MLQPILKEFALNNSNCSVKPVNNGLINHTWLVNDGCQTYILQKINTDIFKQPCLIDENITRIKNYLNTKYPDYLLPSPIKANNGQTLIHAPEGAFRLFHYVKNSVTITVVNTPKQAFEAAKQFGKFSRLLAGFDATKLHVTIPDFHNLDLRYQQFSKALKNANPALLANAKTAIEEINKHRYILQIFSDIQSGKIKLKPRVIHHDTKISNVLFDETEHGICVIDLDTVMPGYYLSDVGDMMRSYLSAASEEETNFTNIRIRPDIFNAIYHGYMAEMGDILTKEEKNIFFYAGEFIIYMQALRFLTDYLNNNVYYAAKYEKHNLNRALNQIHLLNEYILTSKLLNNSASKEKIIS